MLTRTPSKSIADAVRSVCTELERAGLRDLIGCFDPLHPRYAHWLAAYDAAPPELRPLIKLFILGDSVTYDAVASLPVDALDVLEEGEVIQRSGDGRLWLRGLVLLPTLGLWLLCHMPKPNPTLYFGDDSIALAMRLSAERGQRALDLCAGPGIQALKLAQMGAEVLAVEINPMAAALAELNAGINDLTDRVTVRIGNLFEPVGDGRFDRIVANPPLLPIPETMPYPFVGHGGPYGLSITRKILQDLPGRLTPLGYARLLGTTLSDGYLPLCLDELEEIARRRSLDIAFLVTAHHSLAEGAAYFEGLAATSASTGDIDVAEARARYRAFLDCENATHLCAYFLHIVHGKGRVRLIDVATDAARYLWYVT